MRNARVLAAALAVTLAGAGCGFVTEWRIAGEWETEATPKRTLVLGRDGTYSERLSGKKLGFLSDLLGPARGKWHVRRGSLVLVRGEAGGAETTRRLPIERLTPRSMVLAGERFIRVEASP
jgi:hypothetical protein